MFNAYKARHRKDRPVRRRIVATVVAVAVVAGIVTATAPANAAGTDHRPCVTAGEWSQIHKRMPKARVEQILDGSGFLSWRTVDFMTGGVDLWRGYRPCPGFGRHNLFVWYDNYTYGSGFRVWDNYRSENYGG